jgi:hypothetical protein
MKNTPKPPPKSDVPKNIVVISAVLLLLALATMLDLFGGFIFFYMSFAIVFGLQCVIAKLLKRWPVRPVIKTLLLLAPAVILAVLIVFTCNVKAIKISALKTALGTELPTDMTDLHVFDSGFPKFGVFAFFRGSSNSIQKVVSTPIYKQSEYKRQFDFSRRKSWKDLQHMRLITNLTVYARTNVVNGHGEIWVDPDWRFLIVTYGVD